MDFNLKISLSLTKFQCPQSKNYLRGTHILAQVCNIGKVQRLQRLTNIARKKKNSLNNTREILNVENVFSIKWTWTTAYLYCVWNIRIKASMTGFVLRILTRKKHTQKKSGVLTKSMNMDIWIVGTLNQLFKRGS